MADALTNDLFANSVTKNDLSEYQGNGVVNYIMPWYLTLQYSFALPAELPADWTWPAPLAGYWTRDVILRTTTRHEAYWSGAVAKAAAKEAAKSFKVKGNRVDRFKQMLVEWGGDGYVPSQKRTMRDFLTTNNGAFIEIVRVSNAPMSKTLGLVHLDSLRVIRTNDPNTPYVFMDLKGMYHGLREDQVIAIVDMPNTAQAAFGRGECAADSIYDQIYKMAVMNKYLTEKVTGTGANVLDFITGITDKQIDSIITTAAQEAKAKGLIYYEGHIISAILSQVDMKHVQINLRELPDGFDRIKELEMAQLAYAVRIGLDPQDLNPALMGHGALGTGAQSVVLHEKQEGSTLATYEKELTHQIDQKVLPDRMSFHFDESDRREKLQDAQIILAHAQARALQITNGEITGAEARQLAIEAEDMPAEIKVETVMDEDKPATDEQLMNEQPLGDAPIAPPAQPAAPTTPAAPLNIPMKQKEIDMLMALKEEIAAARADLKNNRPIEIVDPREDMTLKENRIIDRLRGLASAAPGPQSFNIVLPNNSDVEKRVKENVETEMKRTREEVSNKIDKTFKQMDITGTIADQIQEALNDMNVTINVPKTDDGLLKQLIEALSAQPAPVVNFNPIIEQAPINVEVKMPEKKGTKFTYDAHGQITGTEPKE